MCDLCRAGGNYFHTPECVYDQLVSEYPVLWLRDSTRIGACYTLRELLSPEGTVLAIQNAPPVTGWRLLPVATTLSAIGAGMERRGEISVLPGEDYAQKALVRLSEQYLGTKEDKP